MLSSKLVLALWPITHAIVVVFLGSVFAFIIKLYGIRRRMVILRKQGLVSEGTREYTYNLNSNN